MFIKLTQVSLDNNSQPEYKVKYFNSKSISKFYEYVNDYSNSMIIFNEADGLFNIYIKENAEEIFNLLNGEDK